jgi:hypothetical protein
MSAFKVVEFIIDRMSFIILRDRWCDTIFLIVNAPTEDKSDDEEDGFYEGLERMMDQLSKYHINILKRDFNANIGREDVFKQAIGSVSLHEIYTDNEVRVLNLPHKKIQF